MPGRNNGFRQNLHRVAAARHGHVAAAVHRKLAEIQNDFPGPQTTTRAGFDVDGVEVKVSLDFGAGFVDWRSWYMSPGA